MKLSEVFEKYLVLNICTKLDLKKLGKSFLNFRWFFGH